MKDNIINKISECWSERAENYSKKERTAMEGSNRQKWESLFYTQIDRNKPLKILDVGTGPGTFAVILGSNPLYEVIGVDINQDMLKQAIGNVSFFQSKATFINIENHILPFDDEYFDVIVSRNVTWNLPQPEDAYKEWRRVLKKGGRILNFDANWHYRLFNKELQEKHEQIQKIIGDKNHKYVTDEMRQKMEIIAREDLPLSKVFRPVWDFDFLMSIGFIDFCINTNINALVYDEEIQKAYAHLPMFMISVVK